MADQSTMTKTNGLIGGAADVARGLGWFSIALGLVDTLSPGMLTRALGMEGKETVLRGYGLREIGTGIGILVAKNPTPWMWGRVAGDALDLATLATGLGNGRKAGIAVALAAVAGVTAIDAACAQALTNAAKNGAAPVRDYSDRRGMPKPPEEMRGAAKDFAAPRDMRTPEALRPWTYG
jgi:hypothetical protein